MVVVVGAGLYRFWYFTTPYSPGAARAAAERAAGRGGGGPGLAGRPFREPRLPAGAGRRAVVHGGASALERWVPVARYEPA